MRLFKDADFLNKPSVLFIIFCFCFSVVTMDLWRKWHFDQNPFVWDTANYYSYLPAIFLNDNSFQFHDDVSKYLGSTPDGEKISRATYGMSFLYSPFFAFGCKLAINAQEPLTGFTQAFADAIHWGSIFYGLLGVILLRNLLIKFYSERTTTFALAISVTGTMLFYYMFGESEMPHNYLFFLTSAFLLLCYHWHRKPTWKISILLSLTFAFIVLIRASEILTGLIFLLWGIKDRASFSGRVKFFGMHWKHLVVMFVVFVLVWIPQFVFWKVWTGTYFYSSYAALGERFYWDDPQLLNILLSYRKGWITYTPLIALAFIGFFFMKNEEKGLRLGIVLVLILNLYVLSCWWDWFFGGCFAARGFCQHIAFLSIPIASLSSYFTDKNPTYKLFPALKLIFVAVVFSGIALNLGMSYQYVRGYIHFNSMTEKSYWHVFGRYHLSGAEEGKYWNALKEPDYKTLKDGTNRDQ